ncbi:hypothetical protein [Sulfurimonas indica]|uniref:hypothetical protein n=1 Tax=Sulfurimonas TaxID=202746 RepID=UPI0012646709|nr:hypothetical protein [Sulfurimonas indica]
MSKLKNRRVWGIELPLLLKGTESPYINYGESRYGYISWKDFLEDLPTIKIPKIGPRGGESWIDIKQAIAFDRNIYNLAINFTDAEFLKIYFENTFLNIDGMIINFKEGSYLLEKWDFVKLQNGSMKYTVVDKFKGGTIKFNTNGVQKFSVWKNGKCLEDRFTSIDDATEFISQGGLHV